MPRSLALPLSLSLLVIAVAPVFGRLRDRLFDRFGAGVFELLGVAVGLVLAAALVVAVVRIRENRPARWAAIVGALALALGAIGGWQTGARVVDLVERVHVVEYGLLGVLYFRAFSGRLRDPTLPAVALAAVVATAALDEWVQWLTPLRVGDVRDLWLDAIAGVAGILFAWGLRPPAAFSRRPSPRSLAVAAWMAALAVAALGGFWSITRLGHEVVDPEHGLAFLSSYPAAELERLGEERAAAWRRRPPGEPPAYSIEDLYLTEAVRHVQERNRAFGAGHHARAYWENRILEVWYAPVLDLVGRRSGERHRWAPEQRAEAARAVPPRHRDGASRAGARLRYRSPVLGDRLRAAPSRTAGLAGTALAVLLLGLAGALAARRGGGAADSVEREGAAAR